MQKVAKRYKVPSKSHPNRFHIVEDLEDDKLRCDCLGWRHEKECRHCRLVRWWKKEVKGNPECCFYTHCEQFLEEHHILRGSDRKMSLTIYLTKWVHELATHHKDFEKHLVDLFIINSFDIMQIKFTAKVKEVSIKNLASMDKGLQVTFWSENIIEAMKLAQLKPKELVKVIFRESQAFATVKNVAKTNFVKKDDVDRAVVILSMAPPEITKVAGLGILPMEENVEIEYNM